MSENPEEIDGLGDSDEAESTESVPQTNADQEQLAARVDRIFAHLWMVRTFVKHAPEVEDFPELMQVVRTIFDASRAVEVHRPNPVAYLRMVKKKRAKLRAAAERFRADAPLASDHTNFKMAVRSLDAALNELDEIVG